MASCKGVCFPFSGVGVNSGVLSASKICGEEKWLVQLKTEQRDVSGEALGRRVCESREMVHIILDFEK